MRAPRLCLAIAATATLALPAAAEAGTSYVVTLTVPAAKTCSDVVRDVSADYAVTPGVVYTSALCGFSTTLSTSKARTLAADPRVAAVQLDSVVVGF